MCHHTTIELYMCPHPTIYVSTCVFILLYVSHTTINLVYFSLLIIYIYRAFRVGEMSEAISAYEKALQVYPVGSTAVVFQRLPGYTNACLALLALLYACLSIPTLALLYQPNRSCTTRTHTELTRSGCAGVSRQPSCCASTSGQVESCAEHVRARAKAVSVLDQGASPAWSRTYEPVVSSSRGPSLSLARSLSPSLALMNLW